MEKERRILTTMLEIRELDEAQGIVIEGYALKFNKLSENLGGFDEVLDPRCLDAASMENVVALFNHNENYPLGRTTVKEGVGALSLSVDGIGLRFSLRPTSTTYSQDLLANMRAGVINQCSFAFTLAEDGQKWAYDRDMDMYHRTITKIDRLWDVSLVTTPAYQDTEAVATQRALANAIKENEAVEVALQARKRKLLLEVEVLD